MLRDAFVLGCMNERFLQLSALGWHLEPENQKSKIQKAVTDDMSKIVANTSRWTPFVWQLAWAIWYGRYANQVKWGAIPIDGQNRLGVVGHKPVNGDKILYGHDDVPRVMVNHSIGRTLKERGIVKEEDLFSDQRSMVLRLKDPKWRQRFIIHKHQCVDADFFEGEMSGGVHGVGLRSQIYWNFQLRDEMLGWAINHLKKMSIGGIMVFYYDEGNPNSKAEAEAAAQNVGERYAIAMPKTRGQSKDTAGVDLLRFEGGGINILINIVKEYFEQHIERLIIGQTLSANAEATGLGSGVSQFHENTKWRILKFDANNLADTFSEDYIPVIQRWNFPKANFRVRFVFDVDDPKADAKLKNASAVFQMGGSVRKDELLANAGLKAPEPDDEILNQEMLLKVQSKVQTETQIELLKAQTQIQMEAQQAQMQQQMQAQQQQAAAQQQMQVPAEGQPQEMPQDQEAQVQQQGQEQAAEQQQAEQQEQQAQEQAAQEQQEQQVQRDEQVAEEASDMTVDQILEEIMGEENTDETEDGNYIRLADGTSVPLDPAPPEEGGQVSMANDGLVIEYLAVSDDEFTIEYKATRAPVGGIDISGKHYEGGQFIPGSVIARASPEEKAALAGQKAISGEKVPEMPASRPQDHGKKPETQQTGMDRSEKQEDKPATVDDMLEQAGIRAPKPDEPILMGNEYDLIQETERWLKTDFKLRPYVMNKIKEFGSLTPHEYARARGRAYQREREVTATGEDTVATMALRIIDQYSGNRSKAFDKKQSLRGVPKAAHETAKYAGKIAERMIRDPKKLRRDIAKSPLAQGAFDKTAISLGIDPNETKLVIDPVTGKSSRVPNEKDALKRLALRAATQATMDLAVLGIKKGVMLIPKLFDVLMKKKGGSLVTSQDDEWMVGYQDEVPASAVMHEYLVELFKGKMQEAMKEAGIEATEEDLVSEASEAAERYAPLMLSMSGIDGEKPMPESKPTEDLRAHIKNVAKNVAGDALVHLLNKPSSDSHSEGAVSLWIRDKIKNRIRRSGIQVSEVALEELANAEASALAPAVARALESYSQKSAQIAPIMNQAIGYEAVHAPKGGIEVGGEHFKGGEFIPKEAIARASSSEKAALSPGKRSSVVRKEKVPGMTHGHSVVTARAVNFLKGAFGSAATAGALVFVRNMALGDSVEHALVVAGKSAVASAAVGGVIAAFARPPVSENPNRWIKGNIISANPKNSNDLVSAIHSSIDKDKDIPNGLKSEFKSGIVKTISSMNPKMKGSLLKNLRHVKFYPTSKRLSEDISKSTATDNDGRVGGAVEVGSGGMFLDGAPSIKHEGKLADTRMSSVYAHEIGHIIDGKLGDLSYSSDFDWKKAWVIEILHEDEKKAPLSSYAMSNAHEGWAEYVRLAITKPNVAKAKFPKCWAVLKKNNLV
jgi:hypothetical protein